MSGGVSSGDDAGSGSSSLLFLPSILSCWPSELSDIPSSPSLLVEDEPSATTVQQQHPRRGVLLDVTEEIVDVSNLPPTHETNNYLNETITFPDEDPLQTFDEKSSKSFENTKSILVIGSELSQLDASRQVLDSRSKPRGILRQAQDNNLYVNKLVEKCLCLLWSTKSTNDLLVSVKKLFPSLCFHEFFNGDCLDSICFSCHFIPANTNLANCPESVVWEASLFIVNESHKPHLKVLEAFIQYFLQRRDVIKILAFSKCVSKVSEAHRMQLIKLLVAALSCFMKETYSITGILYLSHEGLTSDDFNLLLKELNVCEDHSSDYFELFSFLVFKNHNIPLEFLTNIIDITLHSALPCDSGISVDIIKCFENVENLKHLTCAEKNSVQCRIEKLKRYYSRQIYGLGDGPSHSNGCVSVRQHKNLFISESKTALKKKKVRFGEVFVKSTSVVFDMIPMFTQEALPSSDSLVPNQVGFQTSFDGDTFDGLRHVFQNTCCEWLLRGQCDFSRCSRFHGYNNLLFNFESLEKLILAAECYIVNAIHPNLNVLKVLLYKINETEETVSILGFRKCSSKLNITDQAELTKLVLSCISKRMDRWSALNMVLLPENLESQENFFFFSKELLEIIMVDAIENKSVVLRCVSHEIIKRMMDLPNSDFEKLLNTALQFFQKFILRRKILYHFPDLIQNNDVKLDELLSLLEGALINGPSTKYFSVCKLLKFVTETVGHHWKEKIYDVLFKFLLEKSSRAYIISQILNSCGLFRGENRQKIEIIVVFVSVKLIVSLYESKNFKDSFDIFCILREYKLGINNIAIHDVNSVKLALIYCITSLESRRTDDVSEIFWENCLLPFLDKTDTSCSASDLVAVSEKIFCVLSESLLVDQMLKLFNNIFSHQNSVVAPLNIVNLYEKTLRCCSGRSYNKQLRLTSLELFLRVETSCGPTALCKATCRSLIISAYKQSTSLNKYRSTGHCNVLHPLIKKLLVKCIEADAYPKFNSHPEQIGLYSSMSEDEIKIYLIWWLCVFLQAKKRQRIMGYPFLKVKIEKDAIHDDLGLPVHSCLFKVNVDVLSCAERTRSVLKSLISEPLLPTMFEELGQGLYTMNSAVVQLLSEVAFLSMKQQKMTNDSSKKLCAFCLDKKDVILYA